MQAKIGVADSFTIPRIAQLTQKTNQFNLTTRRYTETEVAAMSREPGCAIWWLSLSDRFGPNGIIGVLILRAQSPETWLIDSFLLSCRVMGRTVEHAFLAVVARELGASTLVGEFRPTTKNMPVKDLYERLGFRLSHQCGGADFWEKNVSTDPLEVPPWFEVDVVNTVKA
jgi:FkbH-like protein